MGVVHNKRIEFIDALRGFTMILVVLVHVAGFCLNIDGTTPSIHLFVQQIRMPMFFFVSGFVMYKEFSLWTFHNIKIFLKKKARVQILGTFVFFISYLYVHAISIKDGILSETKYGYWFTFTLFLFYIIYLIIVFLCRRCKEYYTDFIFLFSGCCIYLLAIPAIFETLPVNRNIFNIIGMPYWGLYFFFVLGTLTRKYYVKIEYYLDHKPFLFICLCIFILFNLLSDIITSLSWNLFYFPTALSGIVIIFSFFRIHAFIFRKEANLGKILQFIGKRTLDIYFIHYFLLPINVSKIVMVFHAYPMPIIEYIVSFSITIVIIAFCLLIGAILRLSPEISYWIFGVNKEYYIKLN